MFKGKGKERAVTNMGNIWVQPIRWFWYPYLAFGRVTVLHGVSGSGKSMLAAYLAAACTNRKCFGGMEELEPGNVLYLTADDALSDLLYPRLTEASADLDRVYAIHDLISITLGDNSIEQLLDTHKIRLLIIDPIQEYLEYDVYSGYPELVYPVICKLEKMAKEHECAVLLTAYSDGPNGEKASVWQSEFAEKISSVLALDLPEGRTGKRRLLQEKSILAAEGKPIVFSLRKEKMEENTQPDGKDLFVDMQKRIGCLFMSDMRDKKRQVWEELKRFPLEEYDRKQQEDFSVYVFGVNYDTVQEVLGSSSGQ